MDRDLRPRGLRLLHHPVHRVKPSRPRSRRRCGASAREAHVLGGFSRNARVRGVAVSRRKRDRIGRVGLRGLRRGVRRRVGESTGSGSGRRPRAGWRARMRRPRRACRGRTPPDTAASILAPEPHFPRLSTGSAQVSSNNGATPVDGLVEFARALVVGLGAGRVARLIRLSPLGPAPVRGARPGTRALTVGSQSRGSARDKSRRP